MRITRQAVSPLAFSSSPESFFDSNILVDSNLGDLVYVSSSEYVRKIDISIQSKMPAVGMIVERNENICRIQSSGIVKDIYYGLVPGHTYFADCNSRLTDTPPSGLGCFVQKIGIALDSDTLLLSGSDFILRRAQ